MDLGVIILSRPSAPIGLEEVDRIFKHPAFRKTIHVLLKKARKSITTSYLACEPIMPARDCLLYKFAIDVVRRYNTNDELEIFFGPPLDWTSVKSGVISPQLNIDIAVRSILSCKCDEEVEPIYRGLYSVARLYHRLVGRNVHGRKE
ncbi:hypothetical protein DRN93_03950 [archaeon]|nr:MAG: hypothetical protein DRN93_03950 [archaeon]